MVGPKEDYDETAADLGAEGTILCLSLIVDMAAWSLHALKDNYLTKTNKETNNITVYCFKI